MTTMRAVNESKDRNSGSDVHKSRGILSPQLSMNNGKLVKMSDRRVLEKLKVCEGEGEGEVETDQESGGSSEEFDQSPKSVAKVRQWKNIGRVHSQIEKIREEDSHLGEDRGEGVNAMDHVASQIDFIFSRPILPSSPLSGKNVIKI